MRRYLPALFLVFSCLAIFPCQADQVDEDFRSVRLQLTDEPSLFQRTTNHAENAAERALAFIGIRYRRGGSSPETGFDCSGLVGHVFKTLGTVLPRTAREISHKGELVHQDELQPGDLVFFNTMRRTFSHVGIYLGNQQFVHAPASGGQVRIDNLREKYWSKRYNGARRLGSL
ncbi:MAG: C40 family peptidase [Sterolibacterium sp.]|nr:C40 family peptidase [Sterolibacterium sp.]